MIIHYDCKRHEWREWKLPIGNNILSLNYLFISFKIAIPVAFLSAQKVDL